MKYRIRRNIPMIKPMYVKIILCFLIAALCLSYKSGLSQEADVGRENPFLQFPQEKKPSVSQAVSDTNAAPELFLETITLKSLGAESFRPLIAGMSSPYGSISIDKNSNTLIIYDTKEALAKIRELVPQKEIAAENLVHKSYRIVYANIDEVENTLKAFISGSGRISANPSTGNILVVDFESNIKAIDNFVEEIDRLMQQVLVEVRIYDVTSTDGFDIGAEWAAGRNNPIAALTDVTTKTTTAGVTTTGRVKTDTRNTAWQDSDAGVPIADRGEAASYTYRKSKPFVGGSFDTDVGGTIRLGLLDTVNVDIALNILRTQVGAKLLANPRILVLDNKTAEFKIISEIPYTEASTTSEGGEMTSTQFKEVGVQLKVTPHVTREGMIRLHIVPEFGVVSEKGKTLASGQQTVPTIDTRKVDTEALVKDGQTVVLGGLRKREVTQDVTKVPLLGDIPLLGRLFMDTEEEVKTNELIIFITPRIITEPTLSSAETNSLEATNFGGPKVTYTGDEKAEKSEK
jgi:type IV pilus assembly protein PilQ